MTVDVIFIHGAGSGAYAEDGLLAESLANHLGADFSVSYPRLPEDDEDDQAWLPLVERSLRQASQPLVVVGHSVGGYLILKYLAGGSVAPPIAAICLIAAPYPGAPGWSFDGFDLPDDLNARLPVETRVLLYASEDDQTVPFAHRDLYAAAIPAAVTRETDGGHQLGNDLRLVAQDISDIAQAEGWSGSR